MQTRRFIDMDEAELHKSERREIWAVVRQQLHYYDDRKGMERALERLGYTERQIDDHLGDFADAEYADMTPLERENSSYRFWSDEKPGCRL